MPRKSSQPTEQPGNKTSTSPKPGRKRAGPAQPPKSKVLQPKAQAPDQSRAPALPVGVPSGPPKSNISNPKSKFQNLKSEAAGLLEEFRGRYPFPLDPFQEEAIAFLEAGDSVMV